jgi:hypothetical protein
VRHLTEFINRHQDVFGEIQRKIGKKEEEADEKHAEADEIKEKKVVLKVSTQQHDVGKKTSAIVAVQKALAEAAIKAAQGRKAMNCRLDASEASSLKRLEQEWDVPLSPPKVHHTLISTSLHRHTSVTPL